MTYNITSEDIRSVKTKKALYDAMFSLLRKNSFRKITIKGICEEALISRAAFYAHFIDKYDLLEHCLEKLWPKSLTSGGTYEQIEESINFHVKDNLDVLENLLVDADEETSGILFEYIISVAKLDDEKSGDNDRHIESVVLSNFFVGGIIYYLSWQVKSKFPLDVPIMNRYLYRIINELRNW